MIRRARRSRVITSGFTLVEMLVVVSVIVLLISLLLPSYGRARENAYIAVCANNLHQQGTALFQYRTEFNRYGLVLYDENGYVVRHNDYKVLMVPYVSGFGPFVCPSTNNVITEINDLSIIPTGTTGNWSSYESYGGFDDNTIKSPMNCRRLESKVWMILDQDNPDINWHLNEYDNHDTYGGNALILDGHVKWVTGDEWYAVRWAAQTLRLRGRTR